MNKINLSQTHKKRKRIIKKKRTIKSEMKEEKLKSDTTEIQKIVRNYYGHLYTNKMEPLYTNKMDKLDFSSPKSPGCRLQP